METPISTTPHSSTHATFYFNTHPEILFSGYPAHRGLSIYFLSLFLVAFAAAAAELLSSFIRFLYHRPGTAASHRILTAIAAASVHALRIGLLYLVMLAVMSFNVGVLIAAVVGHGIGFLVLGLGGRWLSDGIANGGDLGYGKL